MCRRCQYSIRSDKWRVWPGWNNINWSAGQDAPKRKNAQQVPRLRRRFFSDGVDDDIFHFQHAKK